MIDGLAFQALVKNISFPTRPRTNDVSIPHMCASAASAGGSAGAAGDASVGSPPAISPAAHQSPNNPTQQGYFPGSSGVGGAGPGNPGIVAAPGASAAAAGGGPAGENPG